jgi:hypothetical protein
MAQNANVCHFIDQGRLHIRQGNENKKERERERERERESERETCTNLEKGESLAGNNIWTQSKSF